MAPVRAQAFGQWSWDGSLGIGQRAYDRYRDGSAVSGTTQTDLKVTLGLNGFLGHPAVGGFRLGADLLATRLKDGRDVDSNNLGFDAGLRLLPRSAFPVSLFARRQTFDHSSPASDGPLASFRLADTRTSWGGRFRMRRGPFRGTVMGLNQGTTTFLDDTRGDEQSGRYFLDWSRSTKRLQHGFRVDRQTRESGITDSRTQTTTAHFDQRGNLSPSWRWDQTIVGVLQDHERAGTSTVDRDDFRLQSSLVRTGSGRDSLNLQAFLGLSRDARRPNVRSYGVSAGYNWRVRRRWVLGPFASYSLQTADHLDRTSRRAGMTASFQKRGVIDTLLSSRVSYGEIDEANTTGDRGEGRTTFSLSGTLGHGVDSGLRKELEIEVNRSEFRLSLDPEADIGGVALIRQGLTLEDSQRARITLSHRWDSRSVGGWAEWRRRESSTDDLAGDRFESDGFVGAAHFTHSRFGINVGAGATEVTSTSSGMEEVTHANASAHWQPWRPLRITATFRADHRDLVLYPDIDGRRVEAGAVLTIGLLAVDLRVFESRESIFDGPENRYRGVIWSISRRLGGYLPVVTGTQRRGVIR